LSGIIVAVKTREKMIKNKFLYFIVTSFSEFQCFRVAEL